MERRPGALRPRRAGTGAASRRPHRSHADLRAIVTGPRRRPLSPPARGLGRSAHRSHLLRADSRGVHTPLRQHAVGQRSHRHRLARRHGAPLCGRRHRRRPLLHAAQPLRAVAAGGDLGRHRRHAAGTGDPQRVAADVDDLRHGGPAHDVHRRADCSARRHAGGVLGVHGAVVHGGRNADAPRVRPSPSILARVGEGTWKLDRHSGPDRRRLSARLGVLRVRRRTLPHRHARLRLVDTFRSAAPSRRAGDLCALALGNRQLAPGRLLGRVPVPRGSARRRRAHRRPLRKARAVSRDRLHRPGDHLRRGTRAVSDAAIVCAPGRAHHSFDRVRTALRLSGSAPRHRPALRIRRRLVRTANLPVRCARHLVPESDGHRHDPRAAVGRLVAKTAVRRVDRTFCGRPQRGVGAAAGSRARRSRAEHGSSGAQSADQERLACRRRGEHRRVRLCGNRRTRPDRHVHDQPDRGRRHRPRCARIARRRPRTTVARAACSR